MVLVQPAKPGGSGSRPRKSIYCWRTKKFVLSIGFGPLLLSLSMMVTVAVDCAPSVAHDGPLRLTVKLSLPSAYESSTMATEKDLEVSPGAKLMVPSVYSKSQRGEAMPLKTLQFVRPAASFVAKPTAALLVVSPERVKAMSTRGWPSLTV